MYIIDCACSSHIGQVRRKNEDNIFFFDCCLEKSHRITERPIRYMLTTCGSHLIAVFDGMGGETCGDEASYTAAQYAKAAFLNSRKKQDSEAWLTQLCHDINLAVFNRAKDMQISRMGSTVAMMYLKGKRAYISNLGDSKVFRLRGGTLDQLSVDHTDEQELKKRGINRKPRLIQHLGIDPNEMIIEPYVTSFLVKRKDYYLLCSDGLTDMLCNEGIQQIIETSKDVVNCVEQLVQKALDNGGKDNITVIVCKIF